MKKHIALVAIAVLASGLLAGCADAPLEDEIEVGYRADGPAADGQVAVAVADASPQREPAARPIAG